MTAPLTLSIGMITHLIEREFLNKEQWCVEKEVLYLYGIVLSH